MYNIKTLNSISPVYQSILTEGEYTVSADVEKPDAILVRSADMHSYPVEENPKYGLHKYKMGFGAQFHAYAGEFDLPVRPFLERVMRLLHR